MPRSVDEYVALHPQWGAELLKLRKVLASTGLDETVKWGAPCYTLDGKNIVGIAAFRDYVGLWFHQGALLTDPDGVLLNAQEGKTKALRQWRFAGEREIKIARVKAYVKEAIENQRAGRSIKPDRNQPIVVPPELEAALGRRARTRKAFESLSKGKQREYAEHIASAKREATRQSRLEKIVPMIEAGIGLHDKYRSC
ncbi:MAG: YdeI/OmpD-associated family protein [Planctomycetes bacterium]|nr:YdeI/OmpD-associated family protein [Planctomycetota bacterium]